MISRRRILILRFFFLLCLGGLGAQVWRWQWREARDLTIEACRQRLRVETTLGWARGDFYDRYGRPLTNQAALLAALALHEGEEPPGSLRYGTHPIAAHLIGYVNPGDGRGAAGLELAYDDILSQSTGRVAAVIVDAHQQPIPGLGSRVLCRPSAVPAGIRLTIDGELQAALEKIADRLLPKGAIVVMSPATGDVLAMVSRPSFDPVRPERYLTDADSPFLNRAVTAYHPGSIFKLVVLAAALESGGDYFHRLYQDPGYADVGQLRFYCPASGHRGQEMTLADAFAFSCNTVFIQIALELGAERLVAMAENLGLSRPALSEVPGESAGRLPAAHGRSPGDVANMAIGQMGVYASPVQIARLVAAVANGGLLPPVRVVMGGETGWGDYEPLTRPAGSVRVLRPETARLMRLMTGGVVRYGTGREASLPSGAGGKTGTAQTGRVGSDGRAICHAWFAGFAPETDPQFVAVVFVEEGDSGGRVAAPIFQAVMQAAIKGGTGTT